MGRLSQNYRNSRSAAKQGKQLEKSNSSPIKESSKIAIMNSKIEKEAKKNLNEIDSFDNLFAANNNFLQDLCYDQSSVKNAIQHNDLSGWQDSDPIIKQFQVDTSERVVRFDRQISNVNSESNNITERQSKRAVSANIMANNGMTPLISRRKILKQNIEYNTYASAQKSSKNEIGQDISPIAPEQSGDKKGNSFSSPQVLLSNMMGSNYRFSVTPKVKPEQNVSSFDISSGICVSQKKQAEQNQQQYLSKSEISKIQDNISRNTVSEWKNYLDRYDSSSDLYNVNLTKKRNSELQSFDDQNEEDKNGGELDFAQEVDFKNDFGQLYKLEQQKSKGKMANLSIDISQIKIASQNNQSFVDEGKVGQTGYQNHLQSSNYNSQNQKDLSSRHTYRTSKSSQANRIFGKKKKGRTTNTTSVTQNNTTQQQYQLNQTTSKVAIPKDFKIRNAPVVEDENIKSSSSSMSEGQNLFNLLTNQHIQQEQTPQINESYNQIQRNNQSNSSSSTGLKQKKIYAHSSLLEDDDDQSQPFQQYATLNAQACNNAYQPQEFLSSKNTLAYCVQSNQNTTPQNKYMDNLDLKNMFYQILTKSKEEKDQIACNKSQILKQISNNYQPKRALNYSSVNAAQQLGKEKIKQVIQQKNNQRIFKQLQSNGNIGGTQSLNHSMNLGYHNAGQGGNINNNIINNSNNNNRSVLCDAGNFKIIRNNKDSNKDDYIIKNTDTNEKLVIHVPHNNNNRNQIIPSNKKSDENVSSSNLVKIRSKSAYKNEDIENISKQPQQQQPYALFSNKKQFFEQTNRVLRPTVQNILAATNENNPNSGLKMNPHLLNNSYCVKQSEKLTPKTTFREVSNSDKKMMNNKIYNSGIYSNLLPVKF